MSNERKPAEAKVSRGGITGVHPDDEIDLFVAPSTDTGFNKHNLRLNPVACWRVDDIRFEFGSSFVRPETRHEFEDLKILLDARQGAPLTLFGHADPVDDDPHNKILSGRRAKAVYAVLTRKTDLWEELYKNSIKGDKWDINEIQIMLNALGYYAGPISGENDEATKVAVEDFQGENGLEVDGVAGKDTRPRLYKAYMDIVCVDQDGNLYQLDPEKDFLAGGADPKGKGDYQGCSEFNPRMIFSEAEHRLFSKPENKAKRDEENEPNRRVVIFLFRPGSRISPDGWGCPRASENISECKKRFWRSPPNGEERRSRREPTTRREFEKTMDTFACRLYHHRFALRSPCEGGNVDVHACAPIFFTPQRPASKDYVHVPPVWAYVAYYKEGTDDLEKVQVCKVKDGKLFDMSAAPAKLECGRDVWMYFTHLEDLDKLDQSKYFRKDRSGLPLLGPVRLRRGPEVRTNLDIWQQKDWLILRGKLVDGIRPEGVLLADWREDYEVGSYAEKGRYFDIYYMARKKQEQEKWDKRRPNKLIQWGPWDSDPVWIGTQPFKEKKTKLILLHSSWHVATFNEIRHVGDNQEFLSYHRYDQKLVAKLVALPKDLGGDNNTAIDALPTPPRRVLLPGDIYWQGQGDTNNCGAYSFSAGMNYWFPFTNNLTAHDGAWYSQAGRVDYRQVPKGARTPADIETAAERFNMNGHACNAEDLDRNRALKVLKLWLQAGVPVLFLVKESRDTTSNIFSVDFWSYHWKVFVGYDGNRFFLRNSGADREYITTRRTTGVDYEKAPVGNDVDSEIQFYDKWKAGGGDIVEMFAPSVDECSFVPLYPKDGMFAGGAAR